MINCYKILEVSNFADDAVIRKAYIKLAKLHHPDVAKNSDGERFKIISKAYDTLSDDNTRHYHDVKLRYYLESGSRTRTATRPRSRPTTNRGERPEHRDPRRPKSREEYEARKKRVERIQLRMDMLYYQKQNNFLQYEYRIIGWIVVSLFGWQQVYSNWFVDEESFAHMFAVLGFFLFGFATFGLYSNLYKMMRFKTYSGSKKYQYFRKSTRVWLIYVFVALALLPLVNSLRKSYHMKHYAKHAIVNYDDIFGSKKIQITFTPMGSNKKIVKHLAVTPNTLMDRQHGWVMIRFSKANPKIMEVVDRQEANYPLPAPLN